MKQRRRAWRVAALVFVLLAAVAVLLRPPAPFRLPTVAEQPRLWQGAYHVHSTRSDGSGTPDEIARAANSAGLDFVILTDHGDATRPPAPPRYVHDVLLIDGVEISTDDGHYVALGMPTAPYPLAGEGRAVAEDVRRLGGLGVLAHPDSPRAALAWHAWDVDADGFEWVNADSTWRAASTGRLLTTLLRYPLGRAAAVASLATYPSTFTRLDQPGRRPQIALAAVDAHARIGWGREADPQEGGRTLLRLPSYAASFGTFGVVVPWEASAPTGEARQDADAVLEAIRTRVAYTAVFSMARPAWLALDLREPLDTALPGPDARGAATLVVRGNAPEGASYRLLRNGVPWREVEPRDPSVRLDADAPGAVYRAELWLPPRRGWPALPLAVSAARTHNLTTSTATPTSAPTTPEGPEVAVSGWHVEHDARSSGTIRSSTGQMSVQAELALAPGGRASQFAALVADLAPPPTSATGLALTLSADGAMRVSVQVREPRPGEGLRWRHSAYVDATPRTVYLPLATFRPITPASGAPPLARLHALLLVLDTVNGRPGDRRALTVHALRWTTEPGAGHRRMEGRPHRGR